MGAIVCCAHDGQLFVLLLPPTVSTTQPLNRLLKNLDHPPEVSIRAKIAIGER